MSSQKILQQSARGFISSSSIFWPGSRLTSIALKGVVPGQQRYSNTDATTPNSRLLQQRLRRPSAPHLSIYRWQITWILSITNRITGLLLSGTFYIFGAAYAASPYFGWDLSADTLAAGFATWPVALAFAVKTVVAWPFTFHGPNGIRHLVWDSARMITNKQVTQTGWAVVSASVAAAVGLALI